MLSLVPFSRLEADATSSDPSLITVIRGEISYGFDQGRNTPKSEPGGTIAYFAREPKVLKTTPREYVKIK